VLITFPNCPEAGNFNLVPNISVQAMRFPTTLGSNIMFINPHGPIWSSCSNSERMNFVGLFVQSNFFYCHIENGWYLVPCCRFTWEVAKNVPGDLGLNCMYALMVVTGHTDWHVGDIKTVAPCPTWSVLECLRKMWMAFVCVVRHILNLDSMAGIMQRVLN
jgi:hypothetical protein